MPIMWKRLFRAALESIRKNPMRSALTMLGIIIGVGSVSILISLGDSAQAEIEVQINENLGPNLIIVTPSEIRAGGVSAGGRSANTLTMDDVSVLQESGREIFAVSPLIGAGAQIIGGIGNWSTQVHGVAPSYLALRGWELAEGTFFTEREVRNRAKVAVLGRTVADELFAGRRATGALVRIRNVPFRVIGILEGKGGSGEGDDQDDVVLAPSTTVLFRLAGGRNVGALFVGAIDASRLSAAEEEVRGILRDHHRLTRDEEDDFEILNQAEIVEFMQGALGTLTVLLTSIAGISLVVGGIGIMNIMLVSVTERTREIGVRLAVGAHGSDILTQFLMEAVLLCLVGGMAGTGLAFAVAFGVTTTSDFTVTVGWSVVGMAAAFSAAIGMFFGFYPARRAARLDPIDALRHE